MKNLKGIFGAATYCFMLIVVAQSATAADNLAVRSGNRVLMDFNYDGAHDREQAYGNGNSENQYLVGDWDER